MNMRWVKTAVTELLIVSSMLACAVPESQPPQEALQQAVMRLKTEAAAVLDHPSQAEYASTTIDRVMERFDELRAATREARQEFAAMNLNYDATAEDFAALFESQRTRANGARQALTAARQDFRASFTDEEWPKIAGPVGAVVAEMSRVLNTEEG